MSDDAKPIYDAIIGGFGVPGRCVADLLERHGVPHIVVELNPDTCARLSQQGKPMICGDVRDESTLRAAGIEHARLLVLAIPNESAVLDAVPIARRLNPGIHIMARCHFTSAGFQAEKLGADEVVVAEQVVARELVRQLEWGLLDAIVPCAKQA